MPAAAIGTGKLAWVPFGIQGGDLEIVTVPESRADVPAFNTYVKGMCRFTVGAAGTPANNVEVTSPARSDLIWDCGTFTYVPVSGAEWTTGNVWITQNGFVFIVNGESTGSDYFGKAPAVTVAVGDIFLFNFEYLLTPLLGGGG